MTNNIKGINPWDTDAYPEAWTWLSGKPVTQQEEFYATVAAAFRALNLKANTVASVPFTIFTANGEEYDNSNEWENKLGILPNPQELLRLDTLSYMTSNTIYNLKTSSVLGDYQKRVKGVYHAISSSFTPHVNASTGQLEYVERKLGTETEQYKPEDPRLIRMWRLDHTTEVLPSQATEARAIMKSAGIMHYQDAWVELFYRNGGVKATLVALKGAVSNETKEKQEGVFSKFFKGIGKWFGRPAMVINAETVDVKTVGAGVDDMKDNKIYEQAIANVAMGTGMPLSLLLANSSNYATAQEEKATWYESDIIPFCRWLAYEYNRQLFVPMGYYMAFQPQTLDPNQQDETEKASAMSQYNKIINECATYDIFIGLADTMGVEITPTLDKALKKYYADKDEKVEEGTLDANGQPIEVKPVDNTEEPEEDKPVEKSPTKWIPSIDQLNELRVYQDVALRRCKKGLSLDFSYEYHHGGLPNNIEQDIASKLVLCTTAEQVKAAFDISGYMSQPDGMMFAPEVKAREDVLKLAEAINRLADSQINHKESDKE